jgi:hypothetical protein
VKVVARKSILSALPALAGIAGFKKASSGGHESKSLRPGGLPDFPKWRFLDTVN